MKITIVNFNLTETINPLESEGQINNIQRDAIENDEYEKSTHKSCLDGRPDPTELDDVFFNFLCSLHSDSSLTRKNITDIFNKMCNDVLAPILKHVDNKEVKQTLDTAVNKINTYHKFKKELKNRKMFDGANQIVISEKTDFIYKNGNPCYDSIKEKITIMPIRQQIKTFLESPNIYDDIVENIKELEKSDSYIQNFIQCSLWRNIKQQFNSDDIVFPCFLYHDDFEPDNPLSSNSGANKLAAFYYTFPVLPQHLLSSPKYIFDALLFTSNLKVAELDVAIKPLVDEFTDLEINGLTLNIKGEEKKVYIIVPLILGDNLAQNELLGFSKGFNGKYFCRLCRMSRENALTVNKIDDKYLRNSTNYLEDLERKQNGIFRPSVFNQLEFFHVSSNYAFDIMHDVLEGVARYDVGLFLDYAIFQEKIIDLWTLNKLKQEFDYGVIEIGNMGPEISEFQIKKHYLVMSASEMRTFVHFFPLIIGHCIKEKRHFKMWSMMTKLTQITDILMQSVLKPADTEQLKQLIESYIKIRLEVSSDNLKPKHHFLLHYDKCITQSGPLHNIMSMVYEQKNRIVKKYSKVSHQRVNLPLSLMYKSVMKFNTFIQEHSNGFPSLFQYKNPERITNDELKLKKYFHEEFFADNVEIQFFKWLRYKGTLFREGFYVAFEASMLHCYKIIDIFKIKDSYYLALEEFRITKFDTHLISYFIGSALNIFCVKNVEEFSIYPFNIHQTIHGGKAFRLKRI